MQPIEAARSWLGWLEEHADQGPALLRQLSERQHELGCVYGGQTLPARLRPAFLSLAQEELLTNTSQVLLDCAEHVLQNFHEDPALRAQIPLGEEEARYMVSDPRLLKKQVIARPDAFMMGDSIKYLEFNAESPAGVAWTDLLEQAFLELPIMKALPWTRFLRGSNCRSKLMTALLESWRGYDSQRVPRVALVDWHDVCTIREHHLVADYLTAHGAPAHVVDPRDMELRGDVLYGGGKPIDLIYRRVILGELLGRKDEPGVRAFLDASQRGLVCVVNPFCTRIPGSKAFMALLSDERNTHYFTSEQQKVLRRVVPWTKLVEHQSVEFHGERGDLPELASKHKDLLVLKPTYSYGGKGVAIGPETDAGSWDSLLHKAVSEPGGWTVQEFVPIPEASFPIFSPEFRLEKFKVNLNPYMFAGRYAGSVVRLSLNSVINVSAGGAVIPTFTLDDAERGGVVPIFTLPHRSALEG